MIFLLSVLYVIIPEFILAFKKEAEDEAIPKDADMAIREDPPDETNGKGIPVMGKTPKFIPIFTDA